MPDAKPESGIMPEPDEINAISRKLEQILQKLDSCLFGRTRLHRLLLTAILARGHVLLEGLPGLGKTALVNALGQLLDLTFRRVQFTPDLLPGDILGAHILQEAASGHREMRFQRGPVFTHLLLGDEINRASPKTQSALLEAMQERTVTLMGETMVLPDPFFVLATQNPIELEGTYPLPEAQLDRFLFKLNVDAPDVASLERIVLERHRGEAPVFKPEMGKEDLKEAFAMVDRIRIPRAVASYIARMVKNSDPEAGIPGLSCYIRHGASPRAAIAIAESARALALLDSRPTAGFADVNEVAPWAIQHRITLEYRAKAEKISPYELALKIRDATKTGKSGLPAGVELSAANNRTESAIV